MFFRGPQLTHALLIRDRKFFNYMKGKGSYFNFPNLHLVEIYGKVLERHEFREMSVVEIFEVVNWYS
jgi:hypothetical protein